MTKEEARYKVLGKMSDFEIKFEYSKLYHSFGTHAVNEKERKIFLINHYTTI